MARRWNHRVSLIYSPSSGLRAQYASGALFIAHIRKEGRPLYDRIGLLAQVMAGPFTVDVRGEIDSYLECLQPYEDPSRFGDNFLFCLSHLYAIGKGVVMLGLANRGILEFNREAAFHAFADAHPDVAREVGEIVALRPFYNLVTGRQPERLPFSYHGNGRSLRETLAAIHAVAKRAAS